MDEVRLLSYFKDELNEQEAQEVEDWCNTSSDNRKILEQLYYTMFVGERVAVMNSIDVDRYYMKFKAAVKEKENVIGKLHKIRWKRYAVPMAAFLTGIVFAIGISFLALNKTSDYIVVTTAGQRAQFVLPDGTRVWLNASTQLAYTTSLWSRERKVDLTGEAYFEVARNERAPFVVNSKDIKTQVLGTKFNIRARSAEEKVVTTLLKGSVRVDLPEREDEGIVLRPGQILNVDTETLQTELTESSSARDVLMWINGKLTFEQKTFTEIVLCLERHFDVHFHFDNEKLKSERFTCEFRTDDNIADILSVLSLTKHFRYKVEGKHFYLSIKE